MTLQEFAESCRFYGWTMPGEIRYCSRCGKYLVPLNRHVCGLCTQAQRDMADYDLADAEATYGISARLRDVQRAIARDRQAMGLPELFWVREDFGVTVKEAVETLADVRRAVEGQDLHYGSALAREVLALRRERDALLKDVRERVAARDNSGIDFAKKQTQ